MKAKKLGPRSNTQPCHFHSAAMLMAVGHNPGLVLPASRAAQLSMKLHAAPGVDAAIPVAVIGRLAGDMTRASFGILNRQSS